MKSNRVLCFVLICCSANWLHAAEQSATVCDPSPSSILAFVGTIAELKPSPVGFVDSITFHATEFLKGESSDQITIHVYHSSCSKNVPKVGGTYLVLTHTFTDGDGHFGTCSQIRPLEQASEQIEYLRNTRTGRTPTEILGDVYVDIEGYSSKEAPVAGAKIQLIGKKNPPSIFVSGKDGQFQGQVSPGEYELKVELPKGYETESSAPRTITVTENNCTQVSVSTRPTASITTRLLDTGGETFTHSSDFQFSVIPLEDEENVVSVFPDEDGNLKVKNLQPGQYVLGFNIYLPPTRFSPVYPPTYYPGVDNRSDAQVITLEAGEQKMLPEMRLKKGQSCEIPVMTTDRTGNPSPLTSLALAYPDYPHFWRTGDERTDRNGTGKIFAVFPGHVLLRAGIQRKDGSRLLSEVAEIDSCPTKPVVLQLSREVEAEPEPKDD